SAAGRRIREADRRRSRQMDAAHQGGGRGRRIKTERRRHVKDHLRDVGIGKTRRIFQLPGRLRSGTREWSPRAWSQCANAIDALRKSVSVRRDMTAIPPSTGRGPLGWLANQPYLLLSLTALFWAGNAIVGRFAAGHIPPVTLSFLRWSGAFLIILPFAWSHLVRDWPLIRARLGMMVLLSITGIGGFNTLQYWALEHTQA